MGKVVDEPELPAPMGKVVHEPELPAPVGKVVHGPENEEAEETPCPWGTWTATSAVAWPPARGDAGEVAKQEKLLQRRATPTPTEVADDDAPLVTANMDIAKDRSGENEEG
eukprot:7685275-Pyramimonas_sp.AAC.1